MYKTLAISKVNKLLNVFFPLISSMNGEATSEFKEQTFMLYSYHILVLYISLIHAKKHCLAAVTVPTTGIFVWESASTI